MYKVLVVENNPIVGRLLSHHFHAAGCEIRMAEDGLQALSLMYSFIPDILFTDIVMPKVGGDVLCRMVRQMPAFENIFVVIYSATAYEDEKRIFDLEADLYIAKGASATVASHISFALDRFRQGKRRENVLHGKEDLHVRSITQELLISRRHYSTMLENLSEAVIEMDRTGRIFQVNRAAQVMLGREVASILSSSLPDYLEGPELGLVKQWFSRVVKGETPPFQSSYGTPLVIGDRQVLLKLARFAEKDECFIIATLQDITERKMVEWQLQVFNDELEARVEQRTRELRETQAQYLHAGKLAAIGKLSASIAHEFSSPLQGIMTILKSLKKTVVLEEGDGVMLDLAIGESERMKNLIRILQDFNRPSSGRKVLMDVHGAIDALLLLCKSDYRRKNIATVVHYDQRLPQILAIPDQIKQVFLNLLNNAADACTQGGVITISTSHDESGISVTVADNGVGIEPEKMDLIFQPFYTTKSAVKGTGLGLSVCHGIVQSHQGEIRVDSRPGEGSSFTVLLPISS